MNTAELKLLLFRKIDSLEESKLQELWGIVENYFNNQKGLDDWADLTNEQKQGLYDAIDEIENGKAIVHEDVMTKYRKRYKNE
jgi:hypothetical protein